MTELALLPSRRALRRLDALAVVTVVVFAALGVLAWKQITNLASIGAGLADVAASLDAAARAIALLGEIPVVGESADRLGGSVAQAADSVAANAAEVGASATVLAVVVGVAIALLPLPLVLGVYLPLRIARRREVRGLRRLLAREPDPMLVEHLAHAAVARVPYAELRRVSRSPWRDLDAGRHRDLAAAELRRIGVPVPRQWSDAKPPDAKPPDAKPPDAKPPDAESPDAAPAGP